MRHLKENNENYLTHLKFAWTVAVYMLFSSCFLLIHGLLPILPVPKLFGIEKIARKMKKWDAHRKIKNTPRNKK